MTMSKTLPAAALAVLLAACGSSSGTAPDAPTAVSVAPGLEVGTATVSFTAPAVVGSSAITGYTVTVSPGGVTATGTASPIELTGLLPRTAYTYSVVATNAAGSSVPATTGVLRFYEIGTVFHEPMTQPNDTVFTGSFTFDTTSKLVSNLTGTLTQAMVGPPMTTVALDNQLSAVAVTLGGVDGLLVTTFKNTTTQTIDPATGTVDPTGFAPGGQEYWGLSTQGTNPQNAYAMVFVNTADPTATIAQAQLDKVAYADCTPDGMMMATCMTGTSRAGYGTPGSMMGEPSEQTVLER
jgi:hypothetical protein